MRGVGVTETAGEKAYRRLRSDIIVGRLAPSQKLRLELSSPPTGSASVRCASCSIA
jgi:hypothetical protein